MDVTEGHCGCQSDYNSVWLKRAWELDKVDGSTMKVKKRTGITNMIYNRTVPGEHQTLDFAD